MITWYIKEPDQMKETKDLIIQTQQNIGFEMWAVSFYR